MGDVKANARPPERATGRCDARCGDHQQARVRPAPTSGAELDRPVALLERRSVHDLGYPRDVQGLAPPPPCRAAHVVGVDPEHGGEGRVDPFVDEVAVGDPDRQRQRVGECAEGRRDQRIAEGAEGGGRRLRATLGRAKLQRQPCQGLERHERRGINRLEAGRGPQGPVRARLTLLQREDQRRVHDRLQHPDVIGCQCSLRRLRTRPADLVEHRQHVGLVGQERPHLMEVVRGGVDDERHRHRASRGRQIAAREAERLIRRHETPGVRRRSRLGDRDIGAQFASMHDCSPVRSFNHRRGAWVHGLCRRNLRSSRCSGTKRDVAPTHIGVAGPPRHSRTYPAANARRRTLHPAAMGSRGSN